MLLSSHPSVLLKLFLVGLCLLCISTSVKAQIDWNIHTTVQVGADAWYLPATAEDDPLGEILNMPDSSAHWRYRDVAPWYTLQSHLRVGTQSEFVLRVRADQGQGVSLDQLSFDHAISPSLGMRAGVLDYRATWCRVYDMDNPWVRENDPFCNNKGANLATASAPALQVYTNFDVGNYRVQGLAGIYRPLAFGYEPQEFSNFILPATATVIKNQKHGVSVSALDKITATELRFSWIGARQSLFESDFIQFKDPNLYPATQLLYHQKVSNYFIGVSWQLMPKVRSRLTYFRSNLEAYCEILNQASGGSCQNEFRRAATVLELGYQANPRDVVSMAISHYAFRQEPVYAATTHSGSVAWRRDWYQGWFSALQLTYARAAVPFNNNPRAAPYPTGQSSAWGAGLRVGYQH